jgi:hypothetical protein
VRRDLGDFQTPPELVAAVLETLGPIGLRWPRVLEPTCGRGNFIGGLMALPVPPREIQGIEIQDEHCQQARALAAEKPSNATLVEIVQSDFFGIDLKTSLGWRAEGPLLVIGNPPWVTTAELGRSAANWQPPKRNIKGLRGLAARTGASNFDVAEAIWLKLIYELGDQTPTIALLCKTSVARRVLQYAHRARLPLSAASIRRIDSAKWFGAAVEACLFRMTLGAANRCREIPVFADLTQTEPESVLGFERGWLIADRTAYEPWAFADGTCPLSWRQGLKHDAAAVMELLRDPETSELKNGSSEPVDVEPEFVYPLKKGRDLTLGLDDSPSRAVLVTQERIGEETSGLGDRAPRFFSYLQSHAETFSNRKSSIYRNQPAFALFGIGPYSFAPFKVAICGLHKEPKFKAMGPVDGRPVMLDDTCYFLPCSTAEEAAVLTALCNDPIAIGLLRSASFRDAKRPVTKALLQRLDLTAILKEADRDALLETAREILAAELGMPDAGRPSEAAQKLEREFRKSEEPAETPPEEPATATESTAPTSEPPPCETE